MITIYVRKLEKEDEKYKYEKYPKILRKIIWILIKKLNIVQTIKIDKDKKEYLIPNIDRRKWYRKVVKKLDKEGNIFQKVQLVLEENLKKYKNEFKKYAIIDGENIFYKYIEDILKSIVDMINSRIEEQEIFVTTDVYNGENINLIRNIAMQVKSINIVTKEIEKYRKVEEILSEYGVSISISNNKRKSLKRSKIIINLDFEEQKLNEYLTDRNVIIINMKNKKMNNLKGFDGIIIQNIKLKLESEEEKIVNKLEKYFNNRDIYESIINTRDKMKKAKLVELYGNNGRINEKELEKYI